MPYGVIVVPLELGSYVILTRKNMEHFEKVLKIYDPKSMLFSCSVTQSIDEMKPHLANITDDVDDVLTIIL